MFHGTNKQQSQGKDRQFLSIKISVMKKCLDCVFIKRYLHFGFSPVVNCKPVVERYHMYISANWLLFYKKKCGLSTKLRPDKMSVLVISHPDIWISLRTMAEGRRQNESLPNNVPLPNEQTYLYDVIPSCPIDVDTKSNEIPKGKKESISPGFALGFFLLSPPLSPI